MKRNHILLAFTFVTLSIGLFLFAQTPASAASCESTVLRKGSTNYSCVKVAQQKLNQWACPGTALAVDGSYGPLTQRAVYRFQDTYNANNQAFGAPDINVDGVVGPQTWNAFNQLAYWDFVLTPNSGFCIMY